MNTRFNPWCQVRVAACCCLLWGCAAKIPIVEPRAGHVAFVVAADTVSQLPMPVALVLSEDFVTYTYEFRPVHQKECDFSMGPLLEEYAQRMAETFFESVEVVPGEDEARQSNAEWVLRPSVLRSDLTSFVVMTGKQYLAVDVEWTLKPKGKTAALWISTFEGQGAGRSSSKEIIESAISDLWQKTLSGFRKLQKLPALPRRNARAE